MNTKTNVNRVLLVERVFVAKRAHNFLRNVFQAICVHFNLADELIGVAVSDYADYTHFFPESLHLVVTVLTADVFNNNADRTS